MRDDLVATGTEVSLMQEWNVIMALSLYLEMQDYELQQISGLNVASAAAALAAMENSAAVTPRIGSLNRSTGGSE